MMAFLKNWQSIAYLGGAAVFGLAAHYVLFKATGMVARRTQNLSLDAFIKHCRDPLRLIIPLMMIHFLFPVLYIPAVASAFLERTLGVVLIVAFAWLVIKLTDVGEEIILNQFKVDVVDNLRARRIHTLLKMNGDALKRLR